MEHDGTPFNVDFAGEGPEWRRRECRLERPEGEKVERHDTGTQSSNPEGNQEGGLEAKAPQKTLPVL